ncbi:MAG: hypothetical protein ACRC0A_03390 [Chitinophagaceae bacterium]
MNIYKYFRILQRINTFFQEKNPLWNKIKIQAINQNHWLTHSFIDLKVQLIRDTFFREKKHLCLQPFCKQSTIQSSKIALVIDDNLMFSGIYELLIGFRFNALLEIKCLPYQKILLEPVVDILNQKKEVVFFVNKISKKNDFYCFYKKKKLSSTEIGYLQKYPYIAHTTKKGIVIIEGNESKENLHFLANQIFSFFGLDHLNVSKILIPKNYNINRLFESFESFSYLRNHPYYLLQYEYHLGVTILQKKEYFTNGFITLVNSQEVHATIGILNFEYYTEYPSLSSQENSNFIIKGNGIESNTIRKLEFENSKKAEKVYSFFIQ